MDRVNRVVGGRYELKRRLGAGGMATVHLAHDPLLSRDVAVKLPRADTESDPWVLDRFEAEIRAAGQLNHPNIVTIYDGGRDGGQPFLVMERVDGESVAALVKREGALPIERAVAIAVQVASALAYAHGLGVVHRDIKPQNVLLDQAGNAKVSDFGIAKSTGDPTRTLTGTVIGTLSFMAPEVAAGQPSTHLADVYSLGVLLYYMLTAHTPFESENPIAEAVRSQQEDPQPPSVHRALPGWLDDVVLRALARDPHKRYQSAGELAAVLAQRRSPAASMESASPPQDTTTVLPVRPAPAARKPRRRRRARFLLGFAALAILAGAGIFVASYFPAIPPQDAAGSVGSAGSPTPRPAPNQNLIANGNLLSFGNAQPQGWQLEVFEGVEPHYFWLPDGPSSGDHELGLSTKSRTDTAWVGSPIQVHAGWRLTLAGYIKVTGVARESGAAIHLVCRSSYGQETGSVATSAKAGSSGWDEAHATFTVPANSAVCEPQLRLGEAGRPTTGTAEFSKASLLAA